MTSLAEKRLLQIAICVCCAVPLAGGLLGVVQGGRWFGQPPEVTLDSHFRYLSGLLLAIGLVFLSTVPRIETHTRTFTVLTTLVAVGGCARMLSIVVDGCHRPQWSLLWPWNWASCRVYGFGSGALQRFWRYGLSAKRRARGSSPVNTAQFLAVDRLLGPCFAIRPPLERRYSTSPSD